MKHFKYHQNVWRSFGGFAGVDFVADAAFAMERENDLEPSITMGILNLREEALGE